MTLQAELAGDKYAQIALHMPRKYALKAPEMWVLAEWLCWYEGERSVKEQHLVMLATKVAKALRAEKWTT